VKERSDGKEVKEGSEEKSVRGRKRRKGSGESK
jgi:hypothetical protein